MPDPGRIALVYCRVSTRQQAEKFSLPAQRKALVEHAKRQGWNYQVLEETGSGETIERRPVFKGALARIAAGEVHTLLVIELSRLSRAQDLHELATIKAVCRAAGCAIATPGQILDLTDADDDLFHTIQGAFSTAEKQKLLARQKRGMAEAKAAGKWHGGGVPTGYRYDREQRTIVPDPERADEVRELLRDALTRGARALRDIYPSWSPTAIQRALSRQRVWWYTGKVELEDGTLIPAAWEPLIDEDLARKLHLAREKKKIVRDGPPGSPNRLLTGLGIFYCGSCGVTMKSHTITKRLVDGTKRRYFYYRCNPWWVQGASFSCANRTGTPCGPLDAQVLAAVWRELPGIAAHERSRGVTVALPSPLAGELEAARGRRDRLVAAVEDGTVTAGEARERLVELRGQIARLTAELERERPEALDLPAELTALLRRPPGKVPVTAGRAMLAAAVERIEKHGEELRIRWKGGKESVLLVA